MLRSHGDGGIGAACEPVGEGGAQVGGGGGDGDAFGQGKKPTWEECKKHGCEIYIVQRRAAFRQGTISREGD